MLILFLSLYLAPALYQIVALYGGRVEDYIRKGGKTLLMYAVINANYDIVALLLREGAGVDCRSYSGMTALMYACKFGFYEVVELFLEHQCDVNVKDNGGRTALMIATNQGHTDTAELLIQKGRNISLDIRSRYGWSSLMFAIDVGNIEIAELLIDAGANIYTEEFTGLTALMIAINRGHSNIAKQLIRHGAYIDLASYMGVISGDTSTELIQYVMSTWHDTPYHSAVYANDVVALLGVVKEGNEDIDNDYWERSIYVSGENTPRTLSTARSSPSDLFLSEQGQIGVASAASLGNSTVENGIDAIDRYGYTALHLAAFLGRIDLAKVLIEKGADAYKRTQKDGFTALHIACERNHVGIISLVITEGVSSVAFCESNSPVRKVVYAGST